MTIWTEMAGLEFRQAYYDVRGVRTRVIEAGKGKPLILLHGTGGHAEAYTRNIAAHAKHFHVYAIDMVGHGYTDRPDLAYGVMDFVGHLKDFLDTIGAKGAYVSGESLGGIVAAWLAVTAPDYVGKLVLNTGILMPLAEPGQQEMRDVLQRSRAVATGMTRELVRKRIEWLMHDTDSVTEEVVDVRFGIYTQPGAGPIMGRIAGSILGGSVDAAWNAEWLNPERMREIKCPTLVLWSRHNPGQPAELAEQGLKYLPHARMEVLENSAHWPQWEEADRFNELHLQFLLE